MNIYLAKCAEDADEKAAAHGSYFSFYYMLHLAVILAESPEEARAELLKDNENMPEDVYNYSDVILIEQIGVSIDPFNKPGVISSAGGTG